jgi:predicted phage tail protein
VDLTATASDTDGSVAKVEFYSGATLLGTDTSSPYSFTWSSVPAGTYSLTAVAYDNLGAKTTSAARSITVTGTATTPPTSIVFQKSVDHTSVTSYRLDVFASGANPATATPLATSDLGKPTPATNGDITVNRATFFSALAAGNYVATVSAIGASGSSRSASVTFSR